MELDRHLLVNGWRSLQDPPDLLLFLDCLLQLYGQPPIALLPRVRLPEYPQGPLSDCIPPAVRDELETLNARLVANDDSVGDTHVLPLALQQDGTGDAIGLQSLVCLLEGARRPVPSVLHEPGSAQQLGHERDCTMPLLETAKQAVLTDAPSYALPRHPDLVADPSSKEIQRLPKYTWDDSFEFTWCRACPLSSPSQIVRLGMPFRPLRSRHFGAPAAGGSMRARATAVTGATRTLSGAWSRLAVNYGGLSRPELAARRAQALQDCVDRLMCERCRPGSCV